ncbi:MAG: glycosyltransferase family 39 protein [Planctomycetes bacterium]|nr:glycosyltransferase family 39 protein [Planctomycetota bacterium]
MQTSAALSTPTGTPSSRLRLSPGTRRFLRISILALVALRVAMIALVPLSDTTEARYAEMARKMLETGDWIMPQFDYGVPFWGKPPLHTWLSASGMALFGVGEFGSRIFILAAMLAVLAMFHSFAHRVQGRDRGLLATAILCSSGLFFVCMGTVSSDPILAACTTVTMIAFWQALHGRTEHRTAYGFAFFAGLALGMLAKGPVAVVLTVLATGGWTAWTRQWSTVLRGLPWLRGSLLAAVLTVPWYAAAELHSPGFLRYFLWGEHVLRFIDPGWDGDLYGNSHAEPLGTIVWFTLLAFLPWTAFVAAALRRPRRIREHLRDRDDGLRRYLAAWLLAPVVLFMPCRNVLPTYALTAMPAAAMLAVDLLAAIRLPSRAVWRSASITLLGLGTLYTVALGTIAWSANTSPRKSHKWIVQACSSLVPDDERGTLYVWDFRYYSAEFYTAGKVRVLHDADALRSVLGNGQRDFLSVRTDHVADLPGELLARFRPVGRFGKDLLFVESPFEAPAAPPRATPNDPPAHAPDEPVGTGARPRLR